MITASLALAVLSLVQGPPDQAEPPVERGLRTNGAGAFDGYTLFAPLLSGSTFLIDMQGRVVHRWAGDLPIGAGVDLLPNGHLLRTIRLVENPRFFGGGLGGKLIEYDWDNQVVWEYTLSNEAQVQHHEVEPLPNGNVLLIAWEYLSPDEAVKLGRDPKAIGPKGLWPDALLEIQPTRPSGGKVVWEWHAKDHLIQDFDDALPNYGSIPDHPELIDINADHRDEPPLTPEQKAEKAERERQMAALGYAGGSDEEEQDPDEPEPDWLHTNAVAFYAEQNLIVCSSPHLNELFVIDHATTTAEAKGHSGGRWKKGGDLLWRWGNPKNYGLGDAQSQRLFGQHDPRWLSGRRGGLALTVFNNGNERPAGKFSSVEELVLPFDIKEGFGRTPGTAFGPAEPRWTYKAQEPESFFSFFISGAERLPNGNTLLCSGAQGRFVEVTPAGETVWEYWNEHGGEIPHSFGNATDRKSPVDPKAVFRCRRIAKEHPAVKGKALKPLE